MTTHYSEHELFTQLLLHIFETKSDCTYFALGTPCCATSSKAYFGVKVAIILLLSLNLFT
jgi:hypothetical protein